MPRCRRVDQVPLLRRVAAARSAAGRPRESNRGRRGWPPADGAPVAEHLAPRPAPVLLGHQRDPRRAERAVHQRHLSHLLPRPQRARRRLEHDARQGDGAHHWPGAARVLQPQDPQLAGHVVAHDQHQQGPAVGAQRRVRRRRGPHARRAVRVGLHGRSSALAGRGGAGRAAGSGHAQALARIFDRELQRRHAHQRRCERDRVRPRRHLPAGLEGVRHEGRRPGC